MQARFLPDKLGTENEELKAKLRLAEEDRELMEAELAKYRDRESLITETMVAAQKVAQELREHAERDSNAMRLTAQADIDALREKAEQEREAILRQARADADEVARAAESERSNLESEIERMRTMRTDVEEAVRSLLLTALEALERRPPKAESSNIFSLSASETTRRAES